MPDPIASLRCAVHPSRPASDRCPNCDRPRCVDDAVSHGVAGCTACLSQAPERPPPSRLEALVATAQVIVPVAVIGGWIYSQYVEVHIFSWLVPILIGIAGVSPGSFLRFPQPRRHPLAVGVVAGVLGTAFGFRLFPHGPHNPLQPAHEVVFPYLCAALGAAVWPIVLGPPRKPKPTAD
ncbi:MAG: hypothetical protein ACTHK4_03605 [Mycobacteriales bacterium]